MPSGWDWKKWLERRIGKKVTMSETAAIVVGAGLGQRMGQDKTFLSLGGKPVIAWSVGTLQQSKSIEAIVIVLHKNNLDAGRRLMTENSWAKVVAICQGGDLRQDSVQNGLKAVGRCKWVLVHDAARPFLTEALINNGIEAAQQTGAAAAAVEVKDTIKQVSESDIVVQTLHRDRLRCVQTPQVFRTDILRKAYEMGGGKFTDDASAVEVAGYKVKLYPGDNKNIKITTPEDLLLAEAIVGGRRP
jgi:2-C-methyl-D-erythritol 4-phosphate cytidylyltransferase